MSEFQSGPGLKETKTDAEIEIPNWVQAMLGESARAVRSLHSWPGDQRKVIDLEQIEGTLIFAALSGPAREPSPASSDNTPELIEMLSEHLADGNWQEIEKIVERLLKSSSGEPANLHATAFSSPAIGGLNNILIIIGNILLSAQKKPELFGNVLQALKDLSLEAEVV